MHAGSGLYHREPGKGADCAKPNKLRLVSVLCMNEELESGPLAGEQIVGDTSTWRAGLLALAEVVLDVFVSKASDITDLGPEDYVH